MVLKTDNHCNDCMYYLGNVSKELKNASSAVIELLQYLFRLQANFYALACSAWQTAHMKQTPACASTGVLTLACMML